MPLHDWSRLEAYAFHGFQLSWFVGLMSLLNNGGLPKDYYVEIERVRPEAPVHIPEEPYANIPPPCFRLVVRRKAGHVGVSVIEIVSPVNKESPERLSAFTERVVAALTAGLHVMVLDIFPPGKHDPHGVHGTVWDRMTKDDSFQLPAGGSRTLVSYSVGDEVSAYIDHPAVGDVLPEMPLFLTPEQYINIQLEAAYEFAYSGTPYVYKEVLDAPASGENPSPP